MVAGGSNGGQDLDSVYIYGVDTRRWMATTEDKSWWLVGQVVV